MICMYTCILSFLLVGLCRTFIHLRMNMFLCNYNAFRFIESLRWIVSNKYIETKNQRLGTGILEIRYILCSQLSRITSRMPHLANYHYTKQRPPLFYNALNHSLLSQKSEDNF